MVQIKKFFFSFYHLLEHLTELQRCVFCCVYEDRQGMQHILTVDMWVLLSRCVSTWI